MFEFRLLNGPNLGSMKIELFYWSFFLTYSLKFIFINQTVVFFLIFAALIILDFECIVDTASAQI